MSPWFTNRWSYLVGANVLFCCVLGFYQNTIAAPGGAGEPFANSVQQRAEMVAELKKISGLLQEQNALLRSGKLRVVVGQ